MAKKTLNRRKLLAVSGAIDSLNIDRSGVQDFEMLWRPKS